MSSNIELNTIDSSKRFLSEYTIESVERDGEEMIMKMEGKEGKVRMKASMKNGKKEGTAVVLRENNTILMELCYKHDELNGEMIVYNKLGKVVERGMLKHGVKWGVFLEYDKDGRVLKEEFYQNGKKRGYKKESQRMKGMLEERNEEGEIISVAEYGSTYTKNGICYEYEGGKVKRKCYYSNGEMTQVMSEINGDKMTEYDSTGKRIYEGGYVFEEEKGMIREGEGTEYGSDGESALFYGFFQNGKRNGEGTLFNGIHPQYIGEWKNGKRHGKGEEYDNNHCLVKKGKWIDDVFERDLIPSFGLNDEMEEYTVNKKSYNTPEFNLIMISNLPKLKQVVIGNSCFKNTTRFIVEGLNELESLKIGKWCFTSEKHENGILVSTKGSECQIISCPKLRKITIGSSSFTDYVKIELKKLPSLLSLFIGCDSFLWVKSFVLKGKCLIVHVNSLIFLQFRKSLSVTILSGIVTLLSLIVNLTRK